MHTSQIAKACFNQWYSFQRFKIGSRDSEVPTFDTLKIFCDIQFIRFNIQFMAKRQAHYFSRSQLELPVLIAFDDYYLNA